MLSEKSGLANSQGEKYTRTSQPPRTADGQNAEEFSWFVLISWPKDADGQSRFRFTRSQTSQIPVQM